MGFFYFFKKLEIFKKICYILYKSALGGDIMFSEQISFGSIKIRNYCCDICDKEIELEASSNKKFNEQLSELGWFRKRVCDKDWHFCGQECFKEV